MTRLSEIYPAKNPLDLDRVKEDFPSFLFATFGEAKESDENIV